MLAMGARIVAVGPSGERVLPIEEFFTDAPFETSLRSNEILTEIRVPAPVDGSGGAYVKLERKVGDFATAAAAAQLTLDSSGIIQSVGIGLTNVGPRPIKAKRAEEFLQGKKPDDSNFTRAAQLASEDAEPSADLRGPVEYKVGLVKELTRRALALAAQRAQAV